MAMKVTFEGGTEVAVSRVWKMRDFATDETRLDVEFPGSDEAEAFCDEDTSDFTLVRTGRTNVRFEGYVLKSLSEDYDDGRDSVTAQLEK